MQKDRLIKIAALILLPAVIMMIPPPKGLSPDAWKIFAIYVSAILGLVLKPFPEPVIMLGAIAASAVLLKNLSGILTAGYASSTTWLVFAAFSLSTAFVKTNLGRRIAYLLMNRLGHSTLGMGYVIAFLELIIAPATPSNTARAGGIVFPIANSVAVALGSEPGPTARKAGAYFMVALFMITKTSSYFFLTAMAPNALAAAMCADILKVSIDWGTWFLAASVPGLLLLLVVPWAVYVMYPPELKKIDGRSIARQGLEELGPMTSAEKYLCVIFVLALLGWIFGREYKVNEGAVAIAAMAVCLFTSVITWDDVLKSKGGWSTLIWFGGIIGLSGVLSKSGFFKWLATWMSGFIPAGLGGFTALIIVVFLSVAVRYLFASGSAYVAAMMPVFLTVGLATGAPPTALALALLFSNSYGGMVTHYGGAAGPILFGSGYPDVKSWWIVGGVLAVVSYAVHMTVGVMWWKMLGLY